MLNSENVPKKSSSSPTKQYKGFHITKDFENVKTNIGGVLLNSQLKSTEPYSQLALSLAS